MAVAAVRWRRRWRPDRREVELLAREDQVGILDHVRVRRDDRLDIAGHSRVVVRGTGTLESVVGERPQVVAVLDRDRLGREKAGRVGRERQRPARTDDARTRQSATVGLRAIAIELEDLPPALSVTEMGPGEAEQRVAGDHRDVAADRRGGHRRCRWRDLRRDERDRGAPCVVRPVRDRGRDAWRNRQHDQGGGDEPLGEQPDSAARRRRRGRTAPASAVLATRPPGRAPRRRRPPRSATRPATPARRARRRRAPPRRPARASCAPATGCRRTR